jgi:predicted secreted protein
VTGAVLSGGASADLVAGREVWRVEAVRAGRSRMSFAGVYDLAWEAAENRWSLVRVHD